MESISRSVVEQHFLDPFIGFVDNIKLDLTQEKIIHIAIAIFAGLMCSTVLMGVLIGLATLYTTTAVSKYVKYTEEMKRIAEELYQQQMPQHGYYNMNGIPRHQSTVNMMSGMHEGYTHNVSTEFEVPTK